MNTSNHKNPNQKEDPFYSRKNGTGDFKRVGIPRDFLSDFYHDLLAMPWWQFFILFNLCYLMVNGFFAGIYFLSGDSILNANPESYWDAFFFSFQTSSTIGYGHFLPTTPFAQVIVIFDTLSGITFVAMATGLAFAKLSRPTARVLFSNNLLITTLNNQKVLIFRVGNARNSQILDASIQAVASMPEISPEGVSMRRLYDLKLVRSRTPLFTLSWTVIHRIDEESPLFHITKSNVNDHAMGVIVSITGIDDVFGQSVYDQHIYWDSDFAFNKKFTDVIGINKKKVPYMDYTKFHQTQDLNEPFVH